MAPRRAGAGWAFAKGTEWTTTPEFGHEDERTWAARGLLCGAGDCLACVWVALELAFSDGFVWYIPEHVPA